jgi:hypothetical protein
VGVDEGAPFEDGGSCHGGRRRGRGGRGGGRGSGGGRCRWRGCLRGGRLA